MVEGAKSLWILKIISDLKRESLKRRDYILYLLASLIGIFSGMFLYLVGSYLWPPRKPFGETVRVVGWIPIAYTHELLPPPSSMKFTYGNIPAILINDGGPLKAFSFVCTHLGCVVEWLPDKRVFSCSCHGGEFDEGGNVTGGPPTEPLNRFDIQIRNGRIYVKPAWRT